MARLAAPRLFALSLAGMAWFGDGAGAVGLPSTPAKPVTDSFFGQVVADPYRWLEDWSDPVVKRWSADENAYSRVYLDAVPQRAAIKARLESLIAATPSRYSGVRAAGGHLFARYTDPRLQQPQVVMIDDGMTTAPSRALDVKVIIDPNRIDSRGLTAVDWFVPSPDGRLVAASLSTGGSENGSVHVFDTATGTEVGEVIPRVQYPTGGGDLAWSADGKGFWYTRYPGEERPEADRHFYMQVYWHPLGGDPHNDSYVLGRDFPRIAEVELDNREGTGPLVISVANGDGGEFEHFLLPQSAGPTGTPAPVTRFADKAVAVAPGPDGALYLISRLNAPAGRLLRLAPGDTNLVHAKVLVPEGKAALLSDRGSHSLAVTDSRVYLRRIEGGPITVAMVAPATGQPLGPLPLPPVSANHELVPLAGNRVLYDMTTYLKAPAYAIYDERRQSMDETKLSAAGGLDFSDAEVVRDAATSADGTSVPVTIIIPKGARKGGKAPALLTGYGGFGVSLTPGQLTAEQRLWLDAGGIYAIANLRGGAEFGEAWHDAGRLTNKQHVFDDFAAVAHLLVQRGYTDADHLALIGGSNGGLLMGATLTQHPDLARAVVGNVGIYDMVRTELDPNGAFNITEYGTVKDSAQFRALYAYSPYHHVTDGVRYPAVLLATGENDGRVNPMHSRKMVARLQAADPAGLPILLRTTANAGHGHGSSLAERVALSTDIYGFLFDQLAMTLPLPSAK
ncbi:MULTISPECIES: prolyl oligopeptidase family serine peptidase [Nitrospirillum]|uniref:prolyl oligopeptidase n=1 Tax=Nitrospirillum amazonense TaxID=28077 RepID=A0A560FUH2_9PROT|nr:prolyl oligopeptidase family serine peptidase [Nitrospirillum amazonense]MEC4592489.1 prolyl oligopeptidase family serine peptidase [Nitrospirillum amazonense]TWB25293.1 prolyl oligopeptidase [Nitrospirillum amazonense]